MDVLISVDLEGVGGVVTRQQTLPGGRDHAAARALMTAEANAAVTGAFAGGATSVTVADSHGPADNIIAEELDRRATLISGEPRPLDMVQGVSPETRVAFFVGYHAGAGDPDGLLGHTFSGGFAQVRLNGVPVGEAEVNALVLAELGVPVGLVTGDDVVCAVAERSFPGVVTVPVKSAVGRTAARSPHPSVARKATHDGALRAARNAAADILSPLPVPGELVVEADLRPSGAAELAALVPGTERLGAQTLRFVAERPRTVLDVLLVWAALTGHYAAR